ncbi:hypothetical protein EGI32_08520 [Ferruginibacter sp. HRS2-29]|nr:hypothetical protein [Ferruginibacter sp. HRS2-29]
MEKFCCDNFRFRHSGDSRMGLNFRIIKLSPEFILRAKYKGNLYRYFISEGYEKLDELKTQFIFMEFCPYCGKELKKVYQSDAFVNETNHGF